MENYLEQLNESQRAAVLKTDGPLMVIAGAGSGKTRVLTYRIAHLINKGVDPFNILSLTFTNKAAKEMKERIIKIIGDGSAKNLWMGTFHSVFAKILRFEGHLLGYPSNFTIYDAQDAQRAIAQIVKEKQLDKDIYKTKTIASRISAYKNALITPQSYFKREDLKAQDDAARIPKLGEIYATYAENCFRSGAMDFDDLLLKTNELLYRFPEVLAKYQDRFKYILVDEYQDTNHAQYLIVKALASKFENVCVVGDDAQSIYAFRGANIANILNFQKDYDNAEVIKLEQNYRSTDTIVQAANSIIKNNKEQLEKNVWTQNSTGEKITVHKSVSDTDEGNYVVQTIWNTHMNQQEDWQKFAILYRTNAQSRSFEDALRRKNIPYRIYGGLSFYQRKEIKDMLAYLRLVTNPNDEEALRRVINYPTRGIGNTTLEKLTIAARTHKKSLWEVIEVLPNPAIKLNNPTQAKLKDFYDKIRSYQLLSQEQNAFDVAAHIAKTSGLIKTLGEDKTPEGVSKYENLQELLNGVKDFTEQQIELENGNPTLAGYLEDIALLTDADNEDPNDKNKVNLMTIHLAKGLEFPYVFIVGMEDNLFPSMMATGSRADLEEERRLFYVALTRAEKQAWLTYAHSRFRWGKVIDCEPSRFLEEIDERFLDIKTPEISNFKQFTESSIWENNPIVKRTSPTASRQSKVSKPSFGQPNRKLTKMESSSNEKVNIDTNLTAGSRVIHERFGMGTISEISGAEGDAKATVNFDNAGEKKLLLKFAKLRRLT